MSRSQMTNPLDSSDLANLILADWHEEYGDIGCAIEIRESVLEPKVNGWDWTNDGFSEVGGCSVGIGSRGGSSGVGYGEGDDDIIGVGGGVGGNDGIR